jgi:glycogen operon protein
MLLAGDEMRRTQRGNNNAYCQDNATSWVDWSLLGRHRDLVRFTRDLFAFRRAHAVLRREAFYTDRDIQWFDPGGRGPDWLDPTEKRLACLIHGGDDPDLFLMFNADVAPATFVLPHGVPSRRWQVAFDTGGPRATEADAREGHSALVKGSSYALAPRASAILIATGRTLNS